MRCETAEYDTYRECDNFDVCSLPAMIVRSRRRRRRCRCLCLRTAFPFSCYSIVVIVLLPVRYCVCVCSFAPARIYVQTYVSISCSSNTGVLYVHPTATQRLKNYSTNKHTKSKVFCLICFATSVAYFLSSFSEEN